MNNSSNGWQHYIIEHRALENIALAYLAAWVNVRNARMAKLPMDRQVHYARNVGQAHDAVCAALEIDRPSKLALWNADQKRAFKIERLSGSTVVSVADEIHVTTEGMSHIREKAYQALVARAAAE